MRLSRMNFTKELRNLKLIKVEKLEVCNLGNCIKKINKISIFYDQEYKEIDLAILFSEVEPKQWIVQNKQPLRNDVLKLNFQHIVAIYDEI